MIFQDPMTSLNPVLTIEEQMVETIRRTGSVIEAEARARTLELLGMVGIPEPAATAARTSRTSSAAACASG